MNYRTPTILAILCSACLVAAILLAGSLASEAVASDGGARECQEDERCWHWSTMGNLDRGIVLRKGASRADCLRTFKTGAIRTCVVDPCGFATSDFRGRIDWKRTARLKGDGFARKHGCNPRLYAPTHTDR